MKNQIILLSVLPFLACTTENISDEPQSVTTTEQVATSGNGMVAAAQPMATQAGLAILEAGGNAADAAVATAFALAVVEPTMNGIGGRNQVLVRTSGGEFQGYNGMTEIPASFVQPETPASSGHGTVAIPGVVASLMRLHKEHGSMPLEEIMKSAINYASNGFEVLPGEARRQQAAHKAMMSDPGFRKQMLKNDTVLYEAGEILKQPDLAQTLTRIAMSAGEDFYKGETAEQIALDMAANGGFVTKEDLAYYKALDARHVTTNYRGFDIHTIPAPAGGGLIVKTLNILENFDLREMSDAQWAAVMNQALALTLQSMVLDYKEEDLEFVQDKTWAKEQAENIVVPEIVGTELVSTILEDDQELLASMTDWTGSTWGDDSHHTTHFVTADCNGMVVSITQTVGPLFGSKVITPGLGFVYASTMGAYLRGSDQAPGSRPRTTIAPTVVTKDGEIVMVLGAAGGIRILSGIVQTISRSIDGGLSLEEAVAAPRVHPDAGIDAASGEYMVYPLKMNAEYTQTNGWLAEDSLVWTGSGLEVTPITRYGAFARVHAVGWDSESKIWTGAADLDWEGTAAGPSQSSCKN